MSVCTSVTSLMATMTSLDLPPFVELHQTMSEKQNGWLLFHNGVQGYFPQLLLSEKKLIEAIKVLFNDEIIPPEKIEGVITISNYDEYTCHLKPMQKRHDFSRHEVINFAEQVFLRVDIFNNYESAFTDPWMSAWPWVTQKKNIDEACLPRLVDSKTLENHGCILSSKKTLFQYAKGSLETLSPKNINALCLSVFGENLFYLQDLINKEYLFEDYLPDEMRIAGWTALGKDVLRYFPELSAHFDTGSIGYYYELYYQYVHGNPDVGECKNRDVSFYGYLLCETTAYQCKSDSWIQTLISMFILLEVHNKKGGLITDDLSAYFKLADVLFYAHEIQEEKIISLKEYTEYYRAKNKKP